MPSRPEFLPALVGPTATGKTALAVALAGGRPIEIVSADSMQVYRDLNIGSAKPSPGERRAAPHHLIDIAGAEERYDIARFLSDADAAIADIRRRGRLPLVVGGAGMYIRGLGEGIFAAPSRDPAVRGALQHRIDAEGAPALHAELSRIDPDAGRRISPNDAIRIVRALEVFQVSGRTISAWHADPAAPVTPTHRLRIVVATRPRDILYERIGTRVRAMLEAGWIDETRTLLERGISPGAHCFKALGYRSVARMLAGQIDPAELPELIARETRQFAKRQLTWFRAMPEARWIDLESLDAAGAERAIDAALFE